MDMEFFKAFAAGLVVICLGVMVWMAFANRSEDDPFDDTGWPD